MKRMAWVLLVVSAALAGACGSISRLAPGTGATPTPSSGVAAPSGNPLTGPALAVSEADAGHTVQVHRGDLVSVTLHEAPNFAPWSVPASSDGAVLVPVVDTRAAAVRGVTLASFKASAAGSAQLTSNAGPVCPPNAPCPAVSMNWTMTVQVA